MFNCKRQILRFRNVYPKRDYSYCQKGGIVEFGGGV
jgi:hypothetical protein